MSEEAHRRGKKKVRKADPEADPEFQIAPMIDILLVLLVFFMSITSTEVLQSNTDVDLPVAKEAKEPKPIKGGQMIVNILFSPINNATTFEVNEKNPSMNEIAAMLSNEVNRNPQYRVLVRADKQVKYEAIRSLLEAVGRAGVGNVTFSVVDKDAGKPQG
ncbi:biopolymer transporter ExbD [Spartobacteria bacterium LR76]|uniref:Biopolymer transport protein ExbD n=1 Tax=Terrimicrobium sacchariphilum TaxID=690879 RepID=A0A146GC67_TERSA|nr:biopolymer transporter ExbD [Terrimicrobium sacchariphilum]PTX95907.1 biopolymer transporter ExbD [Spartobacteria bacterium LR76]GAT34971.1 biopolymer transport protein ExbD [Terrimicrobium sacchariphilum]